MSKGTEMGDTFCRMKRDSTEWSTHESDLSVRTEKRREKSLNRGTDEQRKIGGRMSFPDRATSSSHMYHSELFPLVLSTRELVTIGSWRLGDFFQVALLLSSGIEI